MSTSLKLTNGDICHVLLPDVNELFSKSINRVSLPFHSSKPRGISTNQNSCARLCLNNGDISANDLYNSQNCSLDNESEGSKEKNHSQRQPQKFNEILNKLRRYGISGILSYGLLNTGYYTTTFLFVWFYIAPPPGRMGYLAAAGRFLKIMATVWAGSQVTKLARAAGALALAPMVDRGLSWFTIKYNFKSQGKAFMAIVGFCLGLATLLFLAVTLLSA